MITTDQHNSHIVHPVGVSANDQCLFDQRRDKREERMSLLVIEKKYLNMSSTKGNQESLFVFLLL